MQVRILGNVALHDTRLNAVICEFLAAEVPTEYAALVAYQLRIDQPSAGNIKFCELQGQTFRNCGSLGRGTITLPRNP